MSRIGPEAEVEVDSSNADTDTVLRGDRAVKRAELAQLLKQISGYSLHNFPSIRSEAQINSSTMGVFLLKDRNTFLIWVLQIAILLHSS